MVPESMEVCDVILRVLEVLDVDELVGVGVGVAHVWLQHVVVPASKEELLVALMVVVGALVVEVDEMVTVFWHCA